MMKIDLNADVGELAKALFSKRRTAPAPYIEAEKKEAVFFPHPYRSFAAFTIILTGIFLCAAWLFILPAYQANAAKEAKIIKLEEMYTQLPTLQSQAGVLKRKLRSTKTRYEEILAQFEDNSDMEQLYRAVSNLAVSHNLKVLNVKELGENRVGKRSEMNEVRIDVELYGTFPHYLLFKEGLSEQKKLLNVHMESVRINENAADAGRVNIQLRLSAYAIDKAPYVQAIADNIFSGNEIKKELASND